MQNKVLIVAPLNVKPSKMFVRGKDAVYLRSIYVTVYRIFSTPFDRIYGRNFATI